MTDFTIKRGDDRVLAVAATDADGAQDLTDVTLFFTAKLRRADADEDAVIAKDAADITITDEDAGLFEVALDAEDTDSLEAPLLLLWDIQGIDSTAKVRSLAEGRLLIQADITRRTEALGS